MTDLLPGRRRGGAVHSRAFRREREALGNKNSFFLRRPCRPAFRGDRPCCRGRHYCLSPSPPRETALPDEWNIRSGVLTAACTVRRTSVTDSSEDMAAGDRAGSVMPCRASPYLQAASGRRSLRAAAAGCPAGGGGCRRRAGSPDGTRNGWRV